MKKKPWFCRKGSKLVLLKIISRIRCFLLLVWSIKHHCSLVTLCDYAPCPARMFNMLKNMFIGMFLEHFFNRCRAIACNWHQLAFQVVLLLCEVVLLLCGMMVKCYWCVFGGSHWFISNLVFNRWRRCCSYRDPLGHWSAVVMFEKVYQPGISYHVWQFKSLLLVILNCFLNNFRKQRHHDRKNLFELEFVWKFSPFLL